MKQTFIVKMKKPGRSSAFAKDDSNICFVVEADGAIEAINKINEYTGTYKSTSVSCEIFDGDIYYNKS